jgi:signal transduction histidine kinase
LAHAPERFLGILGHDLRNPLTAMLGAAALLDVDPLTERQTQLVSRIQRSAERMKRMVDVLLDFTRSRCGEGIPVSRAPVDMREICLQIVDEMRLAHPGRAAVFDAFGNLGGHWDGDRVAQVISNLLANALQHGRDPIRLVVRDDGSEVIVEVSNCGAPIPEHTLPTLFEPFVRGEESGHGLGLGLFIAREIVNAHGGRIDVRSDEAATVFAVHWPR